MPGLKYNIGMDSWQKATSTLRQMTALGMRAALSPNSALRNVVASMLFEAPSAEAGIGWTPAVGANAHPDASAPLPAFIVASETGAAVAGISNPTLLVATPYAEAGMGTGAAAGASAGGEAGLPLPSLILAEGYALGGVTNPTQIVAEAIEVETVAYWGVLMTTA